MQLLAERLSLKRLPFNPDDPRSLARIDDETALAALPPGPLPTQIYDAVRSARIAPPTALLLTLEALVDNGSTTVLTDAAALRMLPPSRTLRELYDRLRQLGHGPMDAIVRIMPHTPSFRRW